jgi:hypothetical protein
MTSLQSRINRKRPRRAAAFYALALFFFCAGCAFREPAAFAFSADGAPLALDALSREGEDGVLPLDKAAEYRYELAAVRAAPPDSSFFIAYTLEEDAPLGAAEIVLEFGSQSFIIPLDFSFLALDKPPREIRYAAPLNSRRLHAFTLRVNGGAADKNAALTITGAGLSRRAFGVDEEGEALWLSPYVNAKRTEGARRVISIAPPENAFQGAFELDVRGIQGGAAIYAGNVRREVRGDGNIRLLRALLGDAPFPLRVEGTSRIVLASAAAVPPFPAPLAADVGAILATPQSAWRDRRFEIYRWDLFPSILILDMSDYDFQDKMLRRLAFFAEKKGFRGKLLTDAELEGKHGWNAHDYSPEMLAAFFNAAAATALPLLAEEQELARIAETAGLLIREPHSGRFAPGEGAVISICQESGEELRRRFAAHECYHGIYFVDADFRRWTAERYAALEPRIKRFLRSYFDYLGYDIRDENLLRNEFMAYCLQQSAAAAADYFGRDAPSRLEKTEWRRPALPPRDDASGTWPLLAEALSRETRAFSEYASRRWGLSAGRVWRLY